MNGERRINTCIKEKCELWQLYGNGCPNSVINLFSTKQGQVYPVEDCALKRINNTLMEMSNEIFELKKMIVEMRNEFAKAGAGAQSLITGLHNSEINHIMISKDTKQTLFLGEEKPTIT